MGLDELEWYILLFVFLCDNEVVVRANIPEDCPEAIRIGDESE